MVKSRFQPRPLERFVFRLSFVMFVTTAVVLAIYQPKCFLRQNSVLFECQSAHKTQEGPYLVAVLSAVVFSVV